MPEYCHYHRSHFCPHVAERLYKPPFVAEKDLEPIEAHMDRWDAAEKKYREAQLERWKILQKGDTVGT